MADQTEEKPAAKPEEQAATKPAEKPAEKPTEKAAEKPKEKPAAKPADKPVAAGKAEDQEKKGKKISRMTSSEVEAQLKTTKEKMGAFQSDFAKHLLARKSELIELASKKK